MARAIQRTLLGFLSTAVFFAAFFLVGDILIAAAAAFLVAVAQFVLSRSANIDPSLSMLASLAIVVALTGFNLSGDNAFAEPGAAQASMAQPNCHCGAQKPNPSHAMQVPLRGTPKALAPSGGGV